MAPTAEVKLPTKFGDFLVRVSDGDSLPRWIVIYKQPWGDRPFLRIHSSCLFAESLQSEDCDCALQLHAALETVSKEGGAVVYLYQEGRGEGLFRKVVAMALQIEASIDTAEAYQRLGYELDPRDYTAAAEALKSIEFPKTIRVATNNPRKIEALERIGFNPERVTQDIKLTIRRQKYVQSKVRGLDHYGSD